MSEDSVKISTPMFSLGLTNKEHILEIEEGKYYLIRTWNWRRFGFIHKILRMVDGQLIVRIVKK